MIHTYIHTYMYVYIHTYIHTYICNVDIAALQETCLAGSGSLKEKEYTFFWYSKGEDEPREHGVGFAIRNKLIQLVELGSPISERLMLMKFNTEEASTNLLSVYTPTLTSSQDVKDAFYSKLNETIKCIPKNEALFLLGDFNARVGNDQESWPICLGLFVLTSAMKMDSVC